MVLPGVQATVRAFGVPGVCTVQEPFHLVINLCPSLLPPPPKGRSQGQGTCQPSFVCPRCLRDDKKQFIISLHCKVIKNQQGFLPVWDSREVMAPWVASPLPPHPLLGPLPAPLSDFPSLSVSFPRSPGGRPSEMSKGQASRRASRVWTRLSPNYLS